MPADPGALAPNRDPLAKRMLAGEIDRQNSLKAEIANDAKSARWIEREHLFQNYKQLQFFDTLALYFNRTHPNQRSRQAAQRLLHLLHQRAFGFRQRLKCLVRRDRGNKLVVGRTLKPQNRKIATH
jgi:hypothetical protein